MKSVDSSCKNIQIKIMALLDGELDSTELIEIRKHLDICERCSADYASLKKVKEVMGDMNFKKLPEFYWDDYWTHVYNRIERGISWLFISLGAIIILCFSGWELLNALIADQNFHPLLKCGIFILMVGAVILVISILREKIMVRRVDKYQEIER